MSDIAVPWSIGRVQRCVTPHQRRRQPGVLPQLVVLHCDAGRTEDGTIAWLANDKAVGSYHILVGRDGRSYRFVSDTRCAYHAGRAEWQGVSAVNDLSLGLCFANRNDGTEALAAAQVLTAQFWLAYWVGAFPSLRAVTTHAAVARPTGRKTDPDGMVPHPVTRALVPAVPGFVLAQFTQVLAGVEA